MEKKFKVTALNGIHARPATELVNEAVKYQSEVLLALDGHSDVDLKSIIGIMTLGIYKNQIFTLKITGTDEISAMEGLTQLLKNSLLAEEI